MVDAVQVAVGVCEETNVRVILGVGDTWVGGSGVSVTVCVGVKVDTSAAIF